MGLVRRPLRFGLLAAVLALAVLPAASASAGTKIIGGTNASPGEFPYQVLVSFEGDFICGGSILNATHVITAAHCVEDDPSFNPSIFYPRIFPGSDFTVSYGGVDRDTDGGGSDTSDLTTVGVNHVSVDPRRQRRLAFDEYDSAVLTLSSALSFNANTQPIPLATTDELDAAFSASTLNDLPWITGWGRTNNSGSFPDILQRAQVPLVQDGSCGGAYTPDFTPSVMLCAGTSTKDTCSGDSGGPLAIDLDSSSSRDLRLAGITSFGPDPCAVAGAPGVYTQVPETKTRLFLASNPPAPPQVSGSARVSGIARVGQTATCISPPLPPGVVSQRRFWNVVDSSLNVSEFAETPGPTVTLPAATLGLRIACDVRLENPGGYQYVEPASLADTIGPVGAALTPTVTPPTPDTTKPKASVRKIRCKRRRCRFTFKATDPGGGIVKRTRARVKGKYKKCRLVLGRKRCRTRKVNKRLRLRKKGGGIYTAKIKLKRGRYVVSFIAIDLAGNKSKTARKKFRVR